MRLPWQKRAGTARCGISAHSTTRWTRLPGWCANWLDARRRCISATKPDRQDTGCIGRSYRTMDQKLPFVIRGYKGGCIFNFVSKIFRKRPKSPPPIRLTSLEQYCKFFRERQAQGSALISGQEAWARKIQERPRPKRPGSLPAVIAVRDAVNWQS